MASCTVFVPDDMGKELKKLEGETRRIIEQTLTAGGKACLPIFEQAIKRGVGRTDRSTGELAGSVGLTDVSVKDDSYNIKGGFHEPRSKQAKAKKYHASKSRHGTKRVADRGYYTVSNAMLANIIEYGKSGQPARPMLAPIESRLEETAQEAMKQAFDTEVSKIL